MMTKSNKSIASKIEWVAVAKATGLIVFSFFAGMTIITVVSMLFLGLSEKLTAETTAMRQYEWLAYGVDVFIFLGFYKSISFFKGRRLLNMIVVTMIVAVLPLIGLLWYPQEAAESLINSAIILGIMFAAYGVYLVLNKPSPKQQA